VAAGDIAAAIGLKLTTTGDTLCDPSKPIVLESMTFPEPVIAVAIEPKTRADEERLGVSLSRLALEDPTFRVTSEEETGQTLIGGAIPKEFIPAVEKGVREALETGVLAGYPMVDVKVRLVDGSYHDVDSSEMAFKIAASMGFKEACRKAKPVLLEPVMDVEVVTPEEYMG